MASKSQKKYGRHVSKNKTVTRFRVVGGVDGKPVVVQQQMADPVTNVHFFESSKITTQPNSDNKYAEVGIIHVTHSRGINAVRSVGTGFFNFFGAQGFDNTIFDTARNEGLAILKDKMSENKIDKVCNLRMETDNSNPNMFVLNLYGTALRSKQ
jgi:hypothetical protein